MDRGGRATLVVAAVVAAVAALAIVGGVPGPLEPVVDFLPELLAAPAVLLALRLGRHRPLVSTALVVAIHLLGPATGVLALVAAVNLIALVLVPDLRPVRAMALLHLALACAGFGAVAAVRPGTPSSLAGVASAPWPDVALGLAFVVTVAAAMWRRLPFESTLPWIVAAIASTALLAPGSWHVSVVLGAAEAIVLVGLIEDGRRLAFHDRLTGMPNRRAFEDRVARLRGDYALAVVDVDRFKVFNDRYGHETGDQVLRMVATTLDRVGGGGWACRYGGEEFVVVFPGLAAGEAADHLESLRIAIAERGFVVRSPARPKRRPRRTSKTRKDRRVRVTVSVGVASPGARRPMPDDVLRAADKAMYRAKNAGRNRVVAV